MIEVKPEQKQQIIQQYRKTRNVKEVARKTIVAGLPVSKSWVYHRLKEWGEFEPQPAGRKPNAARA